MEPALWRWAGTGGAESVIGSGTGPGASRAKEAFLQNGSRFCPQPSIKHPTKDFPGLLACVLPPIPSFRTSFF